ncbi:MAG: arginine--tRNA ligase, partial [Dehalococcoidia bacterium]|nr:arginine--tRNA ligase [Dehalococcoidia bacterium]
MSVLRAFEVLLGTKFVMLVADKIKESISSALLSAQTGGSLPNAGKIDVKVEKPRNPEHGDFSTNLPLLLARIMQIAPLKIGSEIRERLSTGEIFSKIDLVKPGFINFTLSDEWLQKSVDRIIMAGNDYGNVENLQPLNVQVEFVSVNPTGPLHVGHARGAVIGSALANILSAAGHKVHKEYYVNDAGNQMRLFNETLYFRYLQASGKNCELPEDMYPGEYILDLAKSIYDSHGERILEMEKDEAINYL